MANKIPLLLTSTMSSIKALEITCNTNEINLDAKLLSLDLVSVSGAKATEAIFEVVDDSSDLGKLSIKGSNANSENTLFEGKAYIRTQPKEVSVSRG